MVGKLISVILCAVAHTAVCCPPIGLGPDCERVYPINLPHCGPEPFLPPAINAPPIITAPQEGPLIPLPHPPIPAPRVIAHKCVCTKTVVKPQIVQRVISVPKIQRYLKRTYRPVVENIQYQSVPQCVESCPPPSLFRVPSSRYSLPLPPLPPSISAIC